MFCDELLTFSFPGARVERERNWRDAFRSLTHNIKLCKKKKIVVFFDELPWMASKGSRLLRTFESFWNNWWTDDPRIKIIVCGSASNWILKNFVNNQGGLYNRVTHSIELEPFDLRQTKEYLKYQKVKLHDKSIVDLYMAIGGIPFYLSKVKPGLSASQNIEQMAFQKKSFLLLEFPNLYATLFSSGDIYIELARAIAEHTYGIGQEELIKKVSKISGGGRVVTYLENLEMAGFIIKLTPFGHEKRGIYYKMVDEYSLFYFRWIEPIKKTLLRYGIKKGYWQSKQSSPAWCSWVGYAFETLVLKHHLQVADTLNLDAAAIPYSWRYVPSKGSGKEGAQIDLLFGRKDNAITICEIKYTKNPITIDKVVAQKLLQRIKIFTQQTRTKKDIFIAFISAAGVKKSIYYDDIVSSNGTVFLEDLFTKIDTW